MCIIWEFYSTIVIEIPWQLYVPSVNQINDFGIAVKLAEEGKGLDYDLTLVPAGTHTLMPLRATLYDFINDPPRYTCLENQPSSYSRVGCFDACVFEEAARVCNCGPVGGNNRTYPACTTKEFYFCLMPEVTQAQKRHEEKKTGLIEYCRSICQPACQYWKYSTEISHAKFPSPIIRRFVMHEEEMDSYNSTIILDVFHEHLEYTVIKHYPSMTADTFIANLGNFSFNFNILRLFLFSFCLIPHLISIF